LNLNLNLNLNSISTSSFACMRELTALAKAPRLAHLTGKEGGHGVRLASSILARHATL
jgi:hypothetical protein